MTKKIYIINANYYEEISDRLVGGAKIFLNENNIDHEIVNTDLISRFDTSYNLIYDKINSDNLYIGFIAIGCVIRGETSHYDIEVNESASGITQLSLSNNIIITNSILTVENKKQALDRSLNDTTNKGYHAAYACNLLIDIKNGKF